MNQLRSDREHPVLTGAKLTHADSFQKCARCGAVGYPGDRFCTCCGEKFRKQCQQCGAVAEHPIAYYCTQCGTALE